MDVLQNLRAGGRLRERLVEARKGTHRTRLGVAGWAQERVSGRAGLELGP